MVQIRLAKEDQRRVDDLRREADTTLADYRASAEYAALADNSDDEAFDTALEESIARRGLVFTPIQENVDTDQNPPRTAVEEICLREPHGQNKKHHAKILFLCFCFFTR
jgi:hypothetical protein